MWIIRYMTVLFTFINVFFFIVSKNIFIYVYHFSKAFFTCWLLYSVISIDYKTFFFPATIPLLLSWPKISFNSHRYKLNLWELTWHHCRTRFSHQKFFDPSWSIFTKLDVWLYMLYLHSKLTFDEDDERKQTCLVPKAKFNDLGHQLIPHS